MRSHGARETREVFEALAAGLAGSQQGLGVKLEGYGFGDVGDLDTPFKMGFRFTMPSPTPVKNGNGKRVDGEQTYWLRIQGRGYLEWDRMFEGRGVEVGGANPSILPFSVTTAPPQPTVIIVLHKTVVNFVLSGVFVGGTLHLSATVSVTVFFELIL